MPHNESRDKDGVSSMVLMSEIALHYKLQGKNLVNVLDDIYTKFAFFFESLLSQDYEGISGSQKISRIMEFFRHYPESHFAGEEIVAKEDYMTGLSTDIRKKTNKAITLPKSDVLSFTFASGNKFFLRPSGTEPKIKFYTMVRETEGDLATKKINALKKVKIIEEKIRECCEKA
jgi:phosphoglucomutase